MACAGDNCVNFIFLTQAGYVKKVLSKFDMLSSKLVYNLMALAIE